MCMAASSGRERRGPISGAGGLPITTLDDCIIADPCMFIMVVVVFAAVVVVV